MKKGIFALVGAALLLASGFVFTGCANDDDDDDEATMTVKLVFSDFTADSVTLKAYNGKTLDDGYQSITAKVASDGKSATCTVTDAHRNDSGWLTLADVVAKKDGTALDISFSSNSNGENGAWFAFAEDGTVTITYALTQEETATQIYSAAYTGTGSYPDTATVPATTFANLTISTLKVKASGYNATDDAAWWINVNSAALWENQVQLEWDDNVSGYSVSITDADVISAIKTNGLFVVAGSDSTCTLSVLYE